MTSICNSGRLNARCPVSNLPLNDNPLGGHWAAWWRGLKPLEKAASPAVVFVFLTSGLAWPIAFGAGYHALGWSVLVGATAFVMAAGLPMLKVLGILTDTDDIRWINLLWWEVLLLVVLANAILMAVTILSAA
jgi:hypothetical protein